MLYQDYGTWLRAELGSRIQKISIDAGLTCPNRDGRVGWGGCSFCNNRAFSPEYCREGETVTEQLELGKRFFARKYRDMRYLAYFQAYTGTYGDVERCISLYEEALSVEGVVGVVIGTRPDCMPDELLDYLERLNRRTFLVVEYGVESANDATLKRINRGHTYAHSVEAVNRTAARGIRVGVHVILGLPGEERTDLLRQAAEIGRLPLATLMHLTVDGVCAANLARYALAEPRLAPILLYFGVYNLVAFGGQWAAGWWLDRRPAHITPAFDRASAEAIARMHG